MRMDRRGFLTAAGGLAAGAALGAAPARAEAKRYRACVIGDTNEGGYGHDLHLAFALQPNVEVVALADPDEAGRARRAAECGAARSYADYREMLETERPDLVSVGPRTTTRHKEYVLACAAVGAHGFLEKPLCVDLEEADTMLAAVSERNLRWQLAYNMRVTPVFDHLKKLVIDEQIIGSVLEIRARGKEDNRAGGEDLIVLGTHLFDMMTHLLGDARWCMADITHNGQPATPAHVREASEALGPIVGNRMHTVFGFDQGVAGHFSTMKTRHGDQGRWGLEILGSTGAVGVRMDVVPTVRILRDGTWRSHWNGAAWTPLPGAPEDTLQDQARERHQWLMADLLAAIEDDREPVAGFAQSIKAQEMIQTCFASHVRGCRVDIPLADRAHPLRGWA